MKEKTVSSFLVGILSAAILLCSGITLADKSKQEKKKEEEKKAITPGAIPRLWRDPGNISQKDLYWGVGSPDGVPRPPFKFVKEDLKGSNPKVDVTDANGTIWTVKFEAKRREMSKVHCEVAANRIVGAFGYVVDEMYFVPSGMIEGATGLTRAKNSLGPDGSFKNARFKRRAKGEKKDVYWNWNKNPFAGTRELSGLKILMIMLGNWDTKTNNNAVLEVPNENGRTEAWYYVSDIGTAFGKLGTWPRRRTMWILEDYQQGKLIKGINGDTVDFHYAGRSSIGKIPLEHARWFARLLGQLSQNQVRKALEAGEATQAEIEGFSSKFMEKIGELQRAVGPQPASAFYGKLRILDLANCGFRISSIADCGLTHGPLCRLNIETTAVRACLVGCFASLLKRALWLSPT